MAAGAQCNTHCQATALLPARRHLSPWAQQCRALRRAAGTRSSAGRLQRAARDLAMREAAREAPVQLPHLARMARRGWSLRRSATGNHLLSGIRLERRARPSAFIATAETFYRPRAGRVTGASLTHKVFDCSALSFWLAAR
jgi:hypothetical protein